MNNNSIKVAAFFNMAFKREFIRWVTAVQQVLNETEQKKRLCKRCLPTKCIDDHNKYYYADYFIRNELNPEKLTELRDIVFDQLFPLIKYSSKSQIYFIMRSLMELLSYKILHRQIESFSALMDVSFLDLLVSSKEITVASALDAKLVDAVLDKIPKDRNGIQVQYDPYKNNSARKVTFWQDKPENRRAVYENEIEREFESTAIKLK